MAPVQKHFTALVMLFKCLLTMVSVAVSLNFGLIAQIIVQHQRLKVQISESIVEKNRLIRRYKHARRRFLLRKRRNRWKNPGRTDVWWTNAWRGLILDEEWLANFRMSREDFGILEQTLRPYICPNTNSFRGDTISSNKKLAMTLYFLKDQGSLRLTANSFGIAPCTLSIAIRKVCHAVVKVLGPQLILYPRTKAGLESLSAKFEEKFNFPMVIGCVDGTHIPIRQPLENAHDYFCFKMKYSINVQAVCDFEGKFIDVDWSWPGSVHDAKVFANSSINKFFREMNIANISRKLNADDDMNVPPVLIGDPAYPLLPSLLKEFPTCTCNEEVVFNQMSRSVRNVIECAFGRLKARWRILNRPLDIAIDYIPNLVFACFILHNFCESRKAVVNLECVNMQVISEKDKQNCTHHGAQERVHSYNSTKSALVRDCFKKYFAKFV